MDQASPLDKAIAAAGSSTALARQLNVAKSAVSNWRRRGKVTADHAIKIQRLFGISALELCPSDVSETPQ